MAIQKEAYELDNRTAVNHEGPDTNKPAERLTATSVIGDRIENPQGEDLGKINNLMINLKSGTIDYVVIEFGSVLGMGGKLFAIPFNELRLDPEKRKRVFILNRDKDYLKKSPGFDKTHWPNTNEHDYFDNVTLYYGSYVPPFP
jgi:sporulation protein YlmC with PRC-barrel domain